MTSAPTLIVFDCDGTLIDSQHVIAEAMRLTFVGAGLPSPERAAILATAGLSVPDALKDLAPELTEAVRASMASGYREWCAALRQQPQMQEPMFKGAAELLLDLAKQDGVVLGLATGKSRRGVMRFIERNRLNGVFATIQTADDAPSKPHPAMLQQAMDETGFGSGATIMVGDTSYDMIMAAYAGVLSIGVGWGYHGAAELTKAGAKYVAESVAALSKLLNRRNALLSALEAVA